MIRCKHIILLAIWAIQTQITYQCGCLGPFNPTNYIFKHVRQEIIASDHFNSVKEDLFSSPSLKTVTLNLKQLNSTIFNTKWGPSYTIIHPITKGVIIDTIIYRDKQLDLHPPPLYREVYKFRKCFYRYLYIMSYYGEGHIYFQIYRKPRLYSSTYSLYSEDKLPDGLEQRNTAVKKLASMFSPKDIVIPVFGNLINQKVSRQGDENQFCVFSVIPPGEPQSGILLSNNKEILDFGGYFTKELPRGYQYFVLFKKKESLYLIISHEGTIERFSYNKDNAHSYSQDLMTGLLQPIVTLEYEDLTQDVKLEPVTVDLTKSHIPPTLICTYYDNELTITPKPNKVIKKVILNGASVDLDDKFPSNYVKVKNFKDVDIVNISGFSGGKPVSIFYIINTSQNNLHRLYNAYQLDSLYVPKELPYKKVGVPVSIEIVMLPQGVSQIGNTLLVTGKVSDTLNFYTCLGKADLFKLENFTIEAPKNCLANFFMYLKGETQSYFISVTVDETGLNVKNFVHIAQRGSVTFRVAPPEDAPKILSELPFQLLVDSSDSFEKPLYLDVETCKTTPGIRITNLPDKSKLYTVDPTSFDDDKKSYIAGVKIGSNHHRLKPGWSQVGVCSIINNETLVIIDEMASSNTAISRSVYLIPHKKSSSILKKTPEIDWKNPVFINHMTIPLKVFDSFTTDYYPNQLLNFVITDSRGLPGVVTKLDFENNNIFYIPSFGSNVIIGDIRYYDMVDKCDDIYKFTVVMHKTDKKNPILHIYRLAENHIKLTSYKFDDANHTMTGQAIYKPNSTNDLLDPIIVDLDLAHVDHNIFTLEPSESFTTIKPKPIEENIYRGGKYKIGTVKLSDGTIAPGYPHYSSKKVECTDKKISIYSQVDSIWLCESYELNGNKYTAKTDPWEDLLTLENIQPRKGMQYITLENKGDTSMHLLRLTESFYYCGSKVPLTTGHAYALLIHNGELNTTLWLYQINSKQVGKGQALQCSNVPFNTPKFNTKWFDSNHALGSEMAKQIKKSTLSYAKISTLNLDLDYIPAGVIKAQYELLTIYTSPSRSVGNVAFGNINLTVNSIFTRVFIGISQFGRHVLVESYKGNNSGVTLDAFKENEPGCYIKIGLDELDGQMEQLLTPFLPQAASGTTELLFPSQSIEYHKV